MPENNDVLEMNHDDYLAPQTVWDELTSETQRLNTLIDSGTELTPNDVKDVSALARQIRNYSTLYRRAVTAKAKDYKQLLDDRLAEIGYTKIEAYVTNKRNQASQLRNQRQNEKLEHFNNLVTNLLVDYPKLNQSNLHNSIISDLSLRFPKLNSGAKNKDIDDWTPIESIVQITLKNAEGVFTKYPLISSLPNTSYSLRALSRYLATGDGNIIDKFKDYFVRDRPLIEEIAINQKFKSDDSIVSQIELILQSDQADNHAKLGQIFKLLNIYGRQHPFT